jgi:hypothetical protein
MENKNLILLLTVLILSVFLLSFVNSELTLVFPLNGTNHSSVTTQTTLLNATFINGTDISVFGSETVQTNVNVSFYTLVGGTETFIANSSSCRLTGTSNLIACWTNISVPSTDGFFNISAKVMNGSGVTNSSLNNISSVYFDSTPPEVFENNFSSPLSNNAYNGILKLNVSIYDLIGFDYGKVFFNVTNSSGIQNATFDAELVGGYWVNDTGLDTSQFPDGRYNITVFVNDSLNNLNNTGSVLNVLFDNTSPSLITLSKVSSTQTVLTISISIQDALSVSSSSTCTVDRAGASVSGTGGSQTLTESGLNCGTTYTYTVTCPDSAGNLMSTSSSTTDVSFKTSSCYGGGPASGGGTTWTNTYVEDSKELSERGTVSKELSVNNRIKLKVNQKTHYVGVKTISGNTVTIEVSSDPQTATMSVGDVRKFDVDGDNVYDLKVTLKSIDAGKANLSVEYLQEEVTEEAIQEQQKAEQQAQGETDVEDSREEDRKNGIFWIILGILTIVIIAAIVWFLIGKNYFKR